MLNRSKQIEKEREGEKSRATSDADIARCVKLVDELKKHGEGQERTESGQFAPLGSSGPNGETAEPVDSERTAETTAQVVGTSATTVKRCRYVDKYADDETQGGIDC